MAKLRSTTWVQILLLLALLCMAIAAPANHAPQVASGSRLPTEALTGVQDGMPLCGPSMGTFSRARSMTKRIVDKVPMPLDTVNSLIEDACIVETLLWDDAESADRLSRSTHGRALADQIQTLQEVRSWWDLAEPLPQQDQGVLGQQKFQDMLSLLAARQPVETVDPSDFRVYPDGWSLLANFRNDKAPVAYKTSEGIYRDNVMITNALYQFMINIKHGILAIETKKQASSMIQELLPEPRTADTHVVVPIPSSISGVLACWWRSQHTTASGTKYYRVAPFAISHPTLRRWTKRLEYIVLPQIDVATDMILTSLGYNEPNGIIPEWPGVTFHAGTHWYLMLLATEPGTVVAEFLYQHRGMLGHKVLESVTVLSLEAPEEQQKPTLIWRVIDYSPQANAQREHMQNLPYQEASGPAGHAA